MLKVKIGSRSKCVFDFLLKNKKAEYKALKINALYPAW